MRPDAVDWNQVDDHLSINTSPRTRLPRLVTRLVLMVIAYQACITAALAFGLTAVAQRAEHPGQASASPYLSIYRFPLLHRTDDLAIVPVVGVAIVGGTVITVFTALIAVRFRIHRWAQGLSHLHVALQRLGNGKEPKPLVTCGEDDIAYLAIAFNRMAAQIIESRQTLIEANELLEKRVARRTAELRQAAQQLEDLASRDHLTGLANRRALVTAFGAALCGRRRTDGDLVCLAFDLDGFKGVNDTLGHEAGDRLLCLAAGIMRQACRENDIAARLGGDEFILMLSIADPADACSIAGRLIEQFATGARTTIDVGCLANPPSMSVGIASHAITGATELEELIRFADEALYEAKRTGKSRYVMSNPAKTPRRHAA